MIHNDGMMNTHEKLVEWKDFFFSRKLGTVRLSGMERPLFEMFNEVEKLVNQKKLYIDLLNEKDRQLVNLNNRVEELVRNGK